MWCVNKIENSKEFNHCLNMSNILKRYSCNIECIESTNCIDLVKTGQANFANLDGGKLYESSKWGAIPILKEVYNEEDTTYYGVAVVNKSFCNDKSTMNDLKGKRSCHTGYGKTSGWKLPLGKLTDTNVMQNDYNCRKDVPGDVQIAENFFASGCAPGIPDSETMCENCDTSCDQDDKYYSYHGAFRCLAEDSGDVAFVKHDTIFDSSNDNWFLEQKFNINDYKLLCPRGGCEEYDDYENCNLGKAPAHAVVINPEYTGQNLIATVRNAFDRAMNDTDFHNLFLKRNEIEPNENSFVFTKGLYSVMPVYNDVRGFMGSMYDNYQSFEQSMICDDQIDQIINTSKQSFIIALSCVGVIASISFMMVVFIIRKERQGNPYFQPLTQVTGQSL